MNEWEQELKNKLRKVFGTDTQQQIADKISTSQSNISKILNGDSTPTLENIYLISKEYGVSVDWLLGLNNKNNNENLMDNSSYSEITNSLLEIIHKGGIYKEETVSKTNITIDDPILIYLLRKGVNLSKADNKYLNVWKKNDLSLFDDTELLYSSTLTKDLNFLFLVDEAKNESNLFIVYEEAKKKQSYLEEALYEPGPFGDSE